MTRPTKPPSGTAPDSGATVSPDLSAPLAGLAEGSASLSRLTTAIASDVAKAMALLEGRPEYERDAAVAIVVGEWLRRIERGEWPTKEPQYD